MAGTASAVREQWAGSSNGRAKKDGGRVPATAISEPAIHGRGKGPPSLCTSVQRARTLKPPTAAWLFARGIEALEVETQSGSMRSTKARSREAGSRPQPTIAACRRAGLLALTKLNDNTCTFGDGIPSDPALCRRCRRDPHCRPAEERTATPALPLLHLTRMRRKGRIKVYPSVYP